MLFRGWRRRGSHRRVQTGLVGLGQAGLSAKLLLEQPLLLGLPLFRSKRYGPGLKGGRWLGKNNAGMALVLPNCLVASMAACRISASGLVRACRMSDRDALSSFMATCSSRSTSASIVAWRSSDETTGGPFVGSGVAAGRGGVASSVTRAGARAGTAPGASRGPATGGAVTKRPLK